LLVPQVALMGQSTGHVRCITDDVLFLAKVESSEFNLVFTPLTIGDVVQRSIQQLNHIAAARGATIAVDIDPSIPPLLLGVGNRLRQVMTNLLGNGAPFVFLAHR
jgi:signal transduction histidine kinase